MGGVAGAAATATATAAAFACRQPGGGSAARCTGCSIGGAARGGPRIVARIRSSAEGRGRFVLLNRFLGPRGGTGRGAGAGHRRGIVAAPTRVTLSASFFFFFGTVRCRGAGAGEGAGARRCADSASSSSPIDAANDEKSSSLITRRFFGSTASLSPAAWRAALALRRLLCSSIQPWTSSTAEYSQSSIVPLSPNFASW